MTREDASFLDYLSAERTERERTEHFNTATRCDACDKPLHEERFEDGDFVVCVGCATDLGGADLYGADLGGSPLPYDWEMTPSGIVIRKESP